MIKEKLKNILNRQRPRRSRTFQKKSNLSKYGLSNLSTSFTKTRSNSANVGSKLKSINENYHDQLISFENTKTSFKSKKNFKKNLGSTTSTIKSLKNVPRLIYSELEDDIEITLEKLGHKRENFEEKGPGIIKQCMEDLQITKMKLKKLVAILRFRKCKEILFHSQSLADTCVQTKLPSIIVVVLDFFIPLLQNFNEISLVEKYSKIMMEYSRKSKNMRGKLRASEFMGFFYRTNNQPKKALKRYFKMLEYALKLYSKQSELKAYGDIGMCYYYMGEIKKSIPFQKRSMMGILEPKKSRLREKEKNNGKNNFESSSEGEEITLQDNLLGKKDESEKNLDEMTPGERLKFLRSFRQANAKFLVKKFEKEKKIIRLPGIMRRMHKEKGRIKNILKTDFTFDEIEKNNRRGYIWDDKRVFMNNHLSPYRNKMMHDIFAQKKFKSYRSRSVKKYGEIGMLQYNSYSKTMGKIFLVIQCAERDIHHLKELYDKLENSYCVHTYYYETQIRKVEEENAKMLAKIGKKRKKRS